MSTYQKKNLIKYTNMRHLIEQLVIIIRVNITKLTSKKSNNILKNQSQQHNDKKMLNANKRSKQKPKHKSKKKFKFLDKKHIKEMQYVSSIATT